MTNPLQSPLNIIDACKLVDVLETCEVVLAGRTLKIRLEHQVKEAIVELRESIDDLCALVDNVLV